MACMLLSAALGWTGGTQEPPPEPEVADVVPGEAELEARHATAGLIGSPVVDHAGNEVGTVDELLVDLTTGRLVHVVLHLDGYQGVSEGRFPIPLYLVYPEPDIGGVRFPLEDPDLLAWAPRMEDHPPETRAPAWHLDVDEYWRRSDAMGNVRPLSPGYRLGADEAPLEFRHHQQASGIAVAQGLIEESGELRDLPLTGMEGEPLGAVSDYVVDLGSGHVSYALVTLDGQGIRAVPLPLFVRRLDADAFEFRGTTDHLADAPGFDDVNGLSEESVAQLRDPQWEETSMDYWAEIDVGARYHYGARVVPGLALDLSTILAHRLVNVHNQPIGEIDDVIIGRDGVVLYVEVTFGGFLGLGETRYPIPISAITADPYGEAIVLDLRRDELDEIPTFEADVLPTEVDDWDADIREYWHRRMVDVAGEAAAAAFEQAVAEREHGGALRAQSVLGFRVVTEAEDEGEVTDLLIDLDQPAVAFVVVEFPADDEGDIVRMPVPVARLHFDPDEQLARLDATEQELRDAPSYPFGVHPVALQDRAWTQEVREHWESEGS